MKTLLLSLLLLFSFKSFGGLEKELADSYYTLDSIVSRKTLNPTEAMFYFALSDIPANQNLSINYDYNGGTGKIVNLGTKRFFEVKLKPGTYYFQLLVNNDYYEITTQKITLKGKQKAFVTCHFQKVYDNMHYSIEKPVLYFYPTVLTQATVKLQPKGELAFSYPAYGKGWNIMAEPNGNITVDDKSYNYLFWESTQNLNDVRFDYSKGFAIDKELTIEFLEEKLNTFGLNSKEIADFITYWGPQLMKNERNYIHFVMNDDCSAFADLTIEPKPAHVYRFYILSKEIPSNLKVDLAPQEIIPIDRTGFTVIEWGGSVIDQIEF